MKDIVKRTNAALSKYSPEILTGLGIAGMVTTTVLAIKATPKAYMLLEDAEDEKGGKLTATETVKVCWKSYIPAAISGAAAIACIVGANSVNAKRKAAIVAAYTMSESTLRTYREKVIETIGEEQEKVVREKVAEERIKRDPVSNKEVLTSRKGDILCYDVISGRYFKSELNFINKVANDLNRRMLTDICGSITLNEFYDELGLEHISIGDDLGWNVDRGQIEIFPDSRLTPDGDPCLVLDYRIAPRYL